MSTCAIVPATASAGGGKADPEAARQPRVAVILPCYNEELAVRQTVEAFRAALPDAVVYVFDNASTDRTSEVARQAGAVVRTETLPGKGNVVRRMFADVEADIYVLADGDATYDASSAVAMIGMLEEQHLDMVVGVRQHADAKAYRRGHQFGNSALTGLVSRIFGQRFSDILSGYRVMSRRFVKTFPSLSKGFEIETELTVHALEIRAPVSEYPTPYAPRPEGAVSKLRTFRDGFRILRLIINLTREERPLPFFGGLALLLVLISVLLAAPVLLSYLETGLVDRQPTWILSTTLFVAALQSAGVGLVLDTVTHGRREAKRMSYLSYPR